MTHEQKKQVKEALLRYTSNYNTQTEAAESLEGISASTISLIKNHNWELLSDRLWHHIARQVGFYCGDWRAADTTSSLLLRILLSDAQQYAMAYGMAMGTGIGKTFTASQYAHSHENVLYIAGKADYNRKSLLVAMLQIIGCPINGTAPDLLRRLTTALAAKDQPLLVIDDAHLLKDRVLHLIVILANSLAGKVGIAIMGGSDLRMRIIDGVRMKKPGYEEIYKMIGRRFITLSCLAPTDVPAVCRANGVHDEDVIKFITITSANNLHMATTLIGEQIQSSIAA